MNTYVGYVRCIQHIEPFPNNPKSAADAIEACRSQVGFIAGRVIGDDRVRPTSVQLFYSADGVSDDAILPEGTRIVLCPAALLKSSHRQSQDANNCESITRLALELIELGQIDTGLELLNSVTE